jgi:hypothetical protein
MAACCCCPPATDGSSPSRRTLGSEIAGARAPPRATDHRPPRRSGTRERECALVALGASRTGSRPPVRAASHLSAHWGYRWVWFTTLLCYLATFAGTHRAWLSLGLDPGDNYGKTVVTSAARKVAVTAARDAHGISERRACLIIGADRSAMRYRHRRADETATWTRLKELATERRRFGRRRLKLLLEREGISMNHKKLRRLPGRRNSARPNRETPSRWA